MFSNYKTTVPIEKAGSCKESHRGESYTEEQLQRCRENWTGLCLLHAHHKLTDVYDEILGVRVKNAWECVS